MTVRAARRTGRLERDLSAKFVDLFLCQLSGSRSSAGCMQYGVGTYRAVLNRFQHATRHCGHPYEKRCRHAPTGSRPATRCPPPRVRLEVKDCECDHSLTIGLFLSPMDGSGTRHRSPDASRLGTRSRCLACSTERVRRRIYLLRRANLTMSGVRAGPPQRAFRLIASSSSSPFAGG